MPPTPITKKTDNPEPASKQPEKKAAAPAPVTPKFDNDALPKVRNAGTAEKPVWVNR